MKETIFIVDGNFYLHRAYAVTRAVHRDFEIALLSMFLGMISKDTVAVRAKKLLICFDGPACFRYKIYPSYKSNRHESQAPVDNTIPGRETAKEIYAYLDPIKALLTELKIAWIQKDEYEADDCCCSASYKWKEQYRVIIGTKDKDSFQYLDDENGVELYDSSYKVKGEPKPRYIDAKLAEELKGVSVKRMRAYQALIGDAIDSIPEIVQPRIAKRIIKEYGTIKRALAENEEYKQLLLPRLEDIKRNAKLVTLVKDIELPEATELSVKRVNLDEELKRNLPKSYFNMLEYVSPRSRSLF